MGSGGDSTASAAETQAAGFQSSLMSMFQTQYGNQQKLLNFTTPILQSMVSNPQGLSPAALAAERTQATDTTATQTQNAEKAAGAINAQHGGATLPSGVAAQVTGDIAATGAATTSQEQNSITQQNEQLKLQNYWKGIAGLSGNAEIENPLGYASVANQSSSAVATLSQAESESEEAAFQPIGSILGGIGGLASGAGAVIGALNPPPS